MGEFSGRGTSVSAGVAAAVIAASAVAASVSEQIGFIVWAASGVLGLVYGLAVVWAVRRRPTPRAAAVQTASLAGAAAQTASLAGAAAQAVAAAEQLVAKAASEAAPAPAAAPLLASGFAASLGHSGTVTQPASA